MTDFVTKDTVKTRYWHALGDGRIQCDLCPPVLQDAQRPARLVFRQTEPGRADCDDQLRSLQRLCD